jgi:hypothetical protein
MEPILPCPRRSAEPRWLSQPPYFRPIYLRRYWRDHAERQPPLSNSSLQALPAGG